MLKIPKLSRTVATAAAFAILSTAVVSADMKSLIEAAGVTADTQLDLAVYSRKGSCYATDGSSRFHTASISKLFTATVILQLRHAGGEAGFESLLALYPSEGFGLVVMGNRKDWPRFDLASALADEVRGKRLCAN
jgi:hypothetical protein